jgi:hypothetical protein
MSELQLQGSASIPLYKPTIKFRPLKQTFSLTSEIHKVVLRGPQEQGGRSSQSQGSAYTLKDEK